MENGKSVGGHWLESNSTEYDLIRYYLTSSTENIGNIEKLSVWKIENHELIYKFEKRSSGMLRLHGWLKADDLTGENNLEQLCLKGFSFEALPKAGMEFNVGSVRLGDNKNQPDEFCFLFYDIAVGRSKIFEGSVEIPDGYDSLYFPPHVVDRTKEGNVVLKDYKTAAQVDQRPSSAYQHKYYINDPLQALPRYIVKFRVNKQKFSRVLDTLSMDIQWIDPITLTPVASPQTMLALGSSSTLDKRALPIEKLYSQATEEIAYVDKDASLQSKTQWVQKQLANLDHKSQEIHANYLEVYQAIEDAAKQAKQKLFSLVHDKLEVCLSMEVELKRQVEQIHWLNDMMTRLVKKYQYAIVDATGNDVLRRKLMYDFLKLWRQHSLILNNISRSRPSELQVLGSLHGDVRIQSDIKLFTDPFYTQTSSGPATSSSSSSQQQQHGAKMLNQAATELLNPMDQYIQEFVHRAHEYNMFSTPIRTSIPYIAPAIQQIIDEEMETIQALIEKEQLTTPCHLPLAFTQPFQSHQTSSSHPIAVHALIESLKKQVLEVQDQVLLSTGVADDNMVAEEGLKTAFINAIPREFGVTSLPAATAATSMMMNNNGFNVQQSAYQPQSAIQAITDFKKQTVRQSLTHIARPGPNLPDAMHRSFGGVAGGRGGSVGNVYDKIFSDDPSSLPEDLMKLTMPLIQLQQVAARFKQCNLLEHCERKQRQIQKKLAAGIYEIGYHSLKKSRLLLPGDVETLYYNLPFFAKPPLLTLIYSTHDHRRALEELYAKTTKNRNPTILLIRSGDYRFGAYLSHPPLPTSVWSGSPACFLFSLTLNLKIPFNARHVLGDTASSLDEPLAFLGDHNFLYIGNGDLSIDDALMNGSTELENSYGLGLAQRSTSAMCLLAGSPLFPIDELEAWTVYN